MRFGAWFKLCIWCTSHAFPGHFVPTLPLLFTILNPLRSCFSYRPLPPSRNLSVFIPVLANFLLWQVISCILKPPSITK